MNKTAKTGAQDVHHEGNAALRNRWLKALTRYGYVARGVLFAAIGFIAWQVASGRPGAPTDQSGALAAMAGHPLGRILLIVVVGGLIGFSLWGFIRAIFDPLDHADGAPGLIQRIGCVVSGVSYGALVLPGIQLLLGTIRAAPKSQTQTTQDVTTQLLAHPYGPWIVGLVGLLVIGWSVGQLYSAYKAKFQEDFKSRKMTVLEKRWAPLIGRLGISARALVYMLMGAFLIQSAWQADPNDAKGLDGALLALAQWPGGPALLIFAALGLIMFGLYSVLCARWMHVS